MTVKIDFALGRRFGVVEKTIFRLVLNGVANTRQISDLLWIFSDIVIANAFRRLVNEQIIRIDLVTQHLSLSDAVAAIIETSLCKSYELDVSDLLTAMMTDENLVVTDTDDDNLKKTIRETKATILAQLLPNVKQSFIIGLAKCFDFRVQKRGEIDE